MNARRDLNTCLGCAAKIDIDSIVRDLIGFAGARSPPDTSRPTSPARVAQPWQ